MRRIVVILVVLVIGAQLLGEPEKAADPMASASYVGASKCTKCHRPAVRKWKKMKHGQAWERLPAAHRNAKAKDADGRLCISCHVTGWGDAERGGFQSIEASKHLLAVQCEACHGPGSKHREAADNLPAGNKKKFPPGQNKFIVRKPTNCADCHNPHVTHEEFAPAPPK